MRTIDVVRLVTLAAIWGAAFMFFRITAPALGPVITALTRVAIAGGLMMIYIYSTSRTLEWREHWRQYLASGTLNSALPFLLFSYALQTIPASYAVVTNATSPLFGILISAAWLGTRPHRGALGGVALGIAGVALIARLGPIALDRRVALALAACLAASALYAVAAIYVRRALKQTDQEVNATASQVSAALVLLPLAPTGLPVPGPVTLTVIASLVTMAVVCSGLGYFLYFKLIESIGPSRALTVTFLQPVFGIAWGALFLGEQVTPLMVAGCLLVIAGTARAVRIRA